MTRSWLFIPVKPVFAILTLSVLVFVFLNPGSASGCMILYILAMFLLLNQEHPGSTAAILAYDALPIKMPRTGGEGKSVVVVGGGISGLTAAKYLIQAGYDVTLLERREIVGGNNDPYLENGEHHATTVIITLPAQQPHYLQLCREYGIEQTPHEFEELKGSIVFENRELNTKMGSGIGGFLKFIYREATLKELGEANWKARLAAMEEVAWRKNHNLTIYFFTLR